VQSTTSLPQFSDIRYRYRNCVSWSNNVVSGQICPEIQWRDQSTIADLFSNFHDDNYDRFPAILLTNKQTNKFTNTRHRKQHLVDNRRGEPKLFYNTTQAWKQTLPPSGRILYNTSASV